MTLVNKQLTLYNLISIINFCMLVANFLTCNNENVFLRNIITWQIKYYLTDYENFELLI